MSLIGHVNRAINLSITPFEPSEWLTGLDAIGAEGDCKTYATVKYFVLRELGIPASQVRLLIVHAHHRNENHMVVAVYLEGQWLILDNLSLALLRDNDEVGFTPLFVLDNSGVRLIRSP